MMQRRQFARLLLAAPIVVAGCSVASKPQTAKGTAGFSYEPGIANGAKLVAPTGRPIRVAFAINP